MGGPGESRPVERREYLIDLYAQGLLLHVDADLDRLAAVAEHARAQTKVKKRLGRPARHVRAEAVAVELAEVAAAIIRRSGADTDEKAHRRVGAATQYSHTRDVFGTFLGSAALAWTPSSLRTSSRRSIRTNDR